MSTQSSPVVSVGWGTADITPVRTSELYGQYYQRVAKGVRDPLSVTALALEQQCEDRKYGQALLISCDQAGVDPGWSKACASGWQRPSPISILRGW